MVWGVGGCQNIMAIIKWPTPTAEYKMLPLMSCLYIRVVYLYLPSYNSISMPIIHKTFGWWRRMWWWCVCECVCVCWGGGQNILAIIKWSTRTREYKILPLLPCLYVCVVYSYHSISMSLIHKTLWLVKEEVVVVVVVVCVWGGGGGGGGQNIMAIIKWPPSSLPKPSTAKSKVLS